MPGIFAKYKLTVTAEGTINELSRDLENLIFYLQSHKQDPLGAGARIETPISKGEITEIEKVG